MSLAKIACGVGLLAVVSVVGCYGSGGHDNDDDGSGGSQSNPKGGSKATGGSSSDGGDSDSAGGDPGSGATGGSATNPAGIGCAGWRDEFCAFGDRCAFLDGASCSEQILAIDCASETDATSCAAALQDASCAAPPVGCDVPDIADPSAAVAACEDFVDALCTWGDECEPGSLEACLTQAEASFDCGMMLGVYDGIDTCMDDMSTLACDAPELPESCAGVFVTY